MVRLRQLGDGIAVHFTFVAMYDYSFSRGLAKILCRRVLNFLFNHRTTGSFSV